ncbi:hypothetical protein [Microbispora sp. ATCC PTA-5024]|uniref:hypothetical protein n=1 Tax=Microbispora sp. ATCC PTA-5024 TaxID=316330 RepID=UPI000406CB8D|nr:hypothetical protein [Microbispora sp. ATCC PTA-5024]
MLLPTSGVAGYIDESIHDNAGLYLIAVVFAHPELGQRVNRELAAVVPTAARPHWHAEDHPTRRLLAAAVSALPVKAVAYGCAFDSPAHKEAARARALRWLAVELVPGVRRLVLDRRQERQDETDRRVLRGMAGRPPRFGVEHSSSMKEPLLWLPDVVAGAAAAHVLGRTAEYTSALGAVLRGVQVEWRA